jgi:cyanate permease
MLTIVNERSTAVAGTTSRNSVPFAAACLWARTSTPMPNESQKVVAVMSAMTVLTPGPWLVRHISSWTAFMVYGLGGLVVPLALLFLWLRLRTPHTPASAALHDN